MANNLIEKSKTAKKAILTSYLDINIPFFDVDPMRIVWHGNYVKYLEQTRCKLLDEIGYNYFAMEDSGYIWPIVDMRLKYVASARFADTIRVYAFLMETESRLKIDYEVYDTNSSQLLTRAHTVQVAVDIKTEEMQFETPSVLLEKVKSYLR